MRLLLAAVGGALVMGLAIMAWLYWLFKDMFR